ncbi:MAG TPA: radical SAM domain-containing protein [Thermoleophilia bacterium]|nr:radical SAM domain-containing protein [Thermoleophilia bacterium]
MAADVRPDQARRVSGKKAAVAAVGVLAGLRRWERATRPGNLEFADAVRARWESLPEHVRTPGQVLGRRAVGCEGTHGVFPRCNLACTPCYHSRDANQVRVDGPHTLANVEAQMKLLRQLRGPHAHAQLIGGEVTLLSPEDHAAAIAVMRRYGREPMSFTHGDVDYDYLRRLATGPDGRRRFARLSFAAHFDMFMFGRRGIERPPDEASLNAYRAEFTAKLRRLRRETGVRTFAAHNMTVTPANLDQVAEVVRATRGMGYGMFSFQPAAFVGDDRRWHEQYRDVDGDAVWAEIERGVGARLDYRIFEHGDVRCNRVAYGFYVGDRWFPVVDGDDPRDLAVRDAFLHRLGAVSFIGTALPVLAVQLARLALREPSSLRLAGGWLVRRIRQVGVRRLLRHPRVRATSYVMHRFMDAADVAEAWELMQRGESSADPRIRETQERLSACHYAMAHPEDGTLVPACVQHGVLDPVENAQLRKLLPIAAVRHSHNEVSNQDSPSGRHACGLA